MRKVFGKRAGLCMKGHEYVQELLGEIEKNRNVLFQLEKFLQAVKANELRTLGKTQSTALIISGILENYYTCLETTFLRIAQFFENNLKPEKWHSELLRKMNLKINGLREAVLSDKTYSILSELLRFRHFKRYYYELEYDWERLDYLLKKLEQVKPLLEKDLDSFVLFLKRI